MARSALVHAAAAVISIVTSASTNATAALSRVGNVRPLPRPRCPGSPHAHRCLRLLLTRARWHHLFDCAITSCVLFAFNLSHANHPQIPLSAAASRRFPRAGVGQCKRYALLPHVCSVSSFHVNNRGALQSSLQVQWVCLCVLTSLAMPLKPFLQLATFIFL